jgi:hypothetical protein
MTLSTLLRQCVYDCCCLLLPNRKPAVLQQGPNNLQNSGCCQCASSASILQQKCNQTAGTHSHKPGGLVLLLQRRSLADLVEAVVRAVASTAAAAALLHSFEQVTALQGVCSIPGLHHQPIEGCERLRQLLRLLLPWLVLVLAAAAVLVVIMMVVMVVTTAALPEPAVQELCSRICVCWVVCAVWAARASLPRNLMHSAWLVF